MTPTNMTQFLQRYVGEEVKIVLNSGWKASGRLRAISPEWGIFEIERVGGRGTVAFLAEATAAVLRLAPASAARELERVRDLLGMAVYEDIEERINDLQRRLGERGTLLDKLQTALGAVDWETAVASAVAFVAAPYGPARCTMLCETGEPASRCSLSANHGGKHYFARTDQRCQFRRRPLDDARFRQCTLHEGHDGLHELED